MKIIIGDKQLKNIISSDLRNFWINWTEYKILINKNKILENNEFESELIKNINFLNCLKSELNINNILNI